MKSKTTPILAPNRMSEDDEQTTILLVNDTPDQLELLSALPQQVGYCALTATPEDNVARFGGDEFTILIDDIKDVSDATRVATRINEELTAPFNLSGHEVFTSTSIGITISSGECTQPEDCLRDADTAMYRAKAAGTGRYEIFGQSIHEQVMRLLKLETDLRRAIERQEFRVYYQPIVEFSTDKVIGLEALVRWQHPESGLLAPAEFITVAEETGLIVPIGEWILREACRQLGGWQQQFPAEPALTMSVNLSDKQFAQPDLMERVDYILHEESVAAGSLNLEVTESVVMESDSVATTVLLQLRALGIKLHIDDFGTGYSSLSYLHRFPIDALKIDRSFVGRMNTEDGNIEIVRTLIQLGHNLKMEVMAEGIETAEQLASLRAFGCKSGQGYFFSAPVDADAASRLIESRVV